MKLLLIFMLLFMQFVTALIIPNKLISLSNVTVGVEFSEFGFASNGLIEFNASILTSNVHHNVSILACNSSEISSIYGASVSTLCHISCTFSYHLESFSIQNVTWNVKQASILHFVATNLDCANLTSSSNENNSNETHSFILSISLITTNPGSLHPQLSFQDSYLPEVSLSLLTISLLSFIAAILSWFVLFRKTKKQIVQEFPFTICMLLVLISMLIQTTISRSYWSSFASSGIPSETLLYFSCLFNSLVHALFLITLYSWLRGSEPKQPPPQKMDLQQQQQQEQLPQQVNQIPIPYLHLDVFWVGCVLTIASICFGFYQEKKSNGWSSGVMIATMIVWAWNTLFCMAEYSAAHKRINNEEHISLVSSDENNEESTSNFTPSTASSKPWARFIGIFSSIEVCFLALPLILPWYQYWIRFELAIISFSCVSVIILLMHSKVNRPPRSIAPILAKIQETASTSTTQQNQQGEVNTNNGN